MGDEVPQRSNLPGLPDLSAYPVRRGDESSRAAGTASSGRRFFSSSGAGRGLRDIVRSPVIVLLLVVAFVGVLLARRPSWPSGVARGAPLQTETSREPIVVGDHTLSPVAAYDIEAVVVDTYRYRFGGVSDLSPFDVGMAWGTAAAPDVLSQLNFSYNGRFLYWQSRGDSAASMDPDEIADQLANVHIIPASPAIRREVARLGAGDVVRMTGLLVDARDAMGGEWITSRTRTDRGAGACEILYVERIERP